MPGEMHLRLHHAASANLHRITAKDPQFLTRIQLHFLNQREAPKVKTTTRRLRLRDRMAHFIANRRLFLRLSAHNAELRNARRADPLTACLNRGAFAEEAFRLLSASRRHPSPIALLIVDIDRLQRINEEHGYPAGDIILTATVAVLRRNIREIDLLCRFGENEFAILIPESAIVGALLVAQRIRKAVAAEPIHPAGYAGHCIEVTVSIGVTVIRKHDISIFDAIDRAQKALSQAKENGRNRVETHEEVGEVLASA
jgi:diguanylate cyclase (GGDEF)-like protein